MRYVNFDDGIQREKIIKAQHYGEKNNLLQIVLYILLHK